MFSCVVARNIARVASKYKSIFRKVLTRDGYFYIFLAIVKVRSQFNVRLDGQIKRRIALDKANTGASKDIITSVALENWFSAFDADNRAKFYRTHGRKPYQRARS